MGLHRRAGPAETGPQQDGEREGCDACVDVDRCAPGEVDDAQLGDPPAVLGVEVEDPVRHGEVDKRGPDGGEDKPCIELRAIGDGTRDQAHGETGEHRLEGDEDHRGHARLGIISHQPLEAEVLRDVAKQTSLAIRRPEGHGVPEEHPQDAHDEERSHDHHHHVEH